jgi:hypothetical protein
VLDELEPGADAVRELDPVARRRAECVQDELADRIRRELAVPEELVEGAVGDDVLVAPVRLDQPYERISRHRALADDRLQPAQQRVLGLALEHAVQVGLEDVEERAPVAGDLVTDLVDEAREAVDREQAAARPPIEEPQRDREVLVRREREDRLLAG